MVAIQLLENGHSRVFSAQSELEVIGTLSFRLSGPGKIVVDAMQVIVGLTRTPVAYQLLDELHRYAHENGCSIVFNCPKVKAVNDRQIAQELHQLSLLNTVAA